MTDQRERFEQWEKDNIPEWLPANGHTRIFARHAWQAATAAAEQDKWEAVRKCVEIVRQWEYSATYISDAIKAEFPEAFK